MAETHRQEGFDLFCFKIFENKIRSSTSEIHHARLVEALIDDIIEIFLRKYSIVVSCCIEVKRNLMEHLESFQVFLFNCCMNSLILLGALALFGVFLSSSANLLSYNSCFKASIL